MQKTFLSIVLLLCLCLLAVACDESAFSTTAGSVASDSAEATPAETTSDETTTDETTSDENAADAITTTHSISSTAPISSGEAVTDSAVVTVGDVLSATENMTETQTVTETEATETEATETEATEQLTNTEDISSSAPISIVASITSSAESAQASDLELGSITNMEYIDSVPLATIDADNQWFYPSSNYVAGIYPVDIYRVYYQTSNELGEPEDAQADLFIPRMDEEAELPMFLYAPGTTGIGEGCAPSVEWTLGRAWGGYRTHMVSYATQGFIGILPDGQNYDNPDRPHEYFIAELEAHTVLDAARAAFNFFDLPAAQELAAQPADALFIGGYSNGGHMAFSAKDFAADYAPELPLSGVISHGATTNVEILMQEAPLFSPYLVYSYRYYFGSDVITPERVFAIEWLPSFNTDVTTKCVDEVFSYYSFDPEVMYNQQFYDILVSGQLAERYPIFKAVLDANYAGTFGGFDVPVAFFQGTADYTVTPPSQERFAYHLCQSGQPVTYEELPAIQHVQTRQSSFMDTIDWMRNIVDGETPRNDCEQILQE